MKLFGITMGDASGVGPEIVLNATLRGELKRPFVLFGDRVVLEFYAEQCGLSVPMRTAASPSDWHPDVLNIIDQKALSREQITPGKLSEASGKAASEYVIAAARSALEGGIAAMVTLPMNKEATQMSLPGFSGHTELIGEVCGVADVTIMLVSDYLIVTHVTTHVSLKQAIELVKEDRIRTIIRLTVDAVRRLRVDPRIAVAGLNPHAGENGLFGSEDTAEILPAVEWAQRQGMPVEGPFPPDTLFHMAVRQRKYEAVVCMYHDQGHVPLKLLDFDNGVNVTLGLPIVRTSVDHGTAFDIAGRGVAKTTSLIRAFDLAARLTGEPVGL
jgi:4-hydroxythreonine-4-phosphate dehydrogenase